MPIQPIKPISAVQRTKQYPQRKPTTDFQKILKTKLDVDSDQVYDTATNDIVEDVDHMSTETVKNLLREE